MRYLLCRAISVIAKNNPEHLKHAIQDKRWYFVRNMIFLLRKVNADEYIEEIKKCKRHSFINHVCR